MILRGIKNDPKEKAKNRPQTRTNAGFRPRQKKRSLLDIFQGCALWPVPPWTTLCPVDGGHSRKQLHPDRPPGINGLTTAPLHRGHAPGTPQRFALPNF